MVAIYSGQAGVLAFVQGAEADVIRTSDEVNFNIRREEVSYLFQGCNDVAVANEVSKQQAHNSFRIAWQNDRALRLLLISIDIEEESELRLEAADCAEELLADERAV